MPSETHALLSGIVPRCLCLCPAVLRKGTASYDGVQVCSFDTLVHLISSMVMRCSGSTVSMRLSRSRAGNDRCVGSVNAPALMARKSRPTFPSSKGNLPHHRRDWSTDSAAANVRLLLLQSVRRLPTAGTAHQAQQGRVWQTHLPASSANRMQPADHTSTSGPAYWRPAMTCTDPEHIHHPGHCHFATGFPGQAAWQDLRTQLTAGNLPQGPRSWGSRRRCAGSGRPAAHSTTRNPRS